MRRALSLVLVLNWCACRPAAPPPRSIESAAREFAQCAFDQGDALFAPNGSSAIEGSIRRALRADRDRFAVRAGRCASALDPALREREPRARALFDAWEAMLPLVQSPQPEEIAIDRAIRRVGLAWRAAAIPSR